MKWLKYIGVFCLSVGMVTVCAKDSELDYYEMIVKLNSPVTYTIEKQISKEGDTALIDFRTAVVTPFERRVYVWRHSWQEDFWKREKRSKVYMCLHRDNILNYFRAEFEKLARQALIDALKDEKISEDELTLILGYMWNDAQNKVGIYFSDIAKPNNQWPSDGIRFGADGNAYNRCKK